MSAPFRPTRSGRAMIGGGYAVRVSWGTGIALTVILGCETGPPSAPNDSDPDGDRSEEVAFRPPPGISWCGAWENLPEAAPRVERRIRNGATDPGDWPLTPGQRNTVVALVAQRQTPEAPSGGVICTGLLISRRLVATAAHCLLAVGGALRPVDDVAVTFGPHAAQPLGRIAAKRFLIHPEADRYGERRHFGLVELAADIADLWPGLAPLALDLSGNDNPPPGEAVMAVGFGRHHPQQPPSGLRLWLRQRVMTTSPYAIETDGEGLGAPCGGDSGSPLLRALNIPNKGWGSLAVGLLYGGDRDCLARNVYSAVDPQGFVATTMAAMPHSGCGLLGAASLCDGSRRLACVSGHIVVDNCVTQEEWCQYTTRFPPGTSLSPETEIPPQATCAPNPCAPEESYRRCESISRLTGCHAGRPFTFHCAYCGQRCEERPAPGGTTDPWAECVDPGLP